MRTASRSYSQFGQDRLVIDTLFPGRHDGVFIDIGAYDGETFSNSALLERQFGWRGICIEPLPDAFAKLKATRNCVSVNAAAGERTGGKPDLRHDRRARRHAIGRQGHPARAARGPHP